MRMIKKGADWFKKGAKSAAATNTKSFFARQTTKILKGTKNDPLVKFMIGLGRLGAWGGEQVGTRTYRLGRKFRRIGEEVGKIGKAHPRTAAFVKGGAKLGGAAMRKVGVPTLLGVGALGMVGVGMMRGAMNQGRDIVFDRYMQDQRYSRNILTNSRLGRSAGTRNMNRYGSTQGLSQALSASRHGRY